MFSFLAESAGLEPANMGVKDPRLRPTWRTLNIRCLYIKVLKEELETITRRCPHNPFLTRMKRIGHRTVTRRRKPSMALRDGVEPSTLTLTEFRSTN